MKISELSNAEKKYFLEMLICFEMGVISQTKMFLGHLHNDFLVTYISVNTSWILSVQPGRPCANSMQACFEFRLTKVGMSVLHVNTNQRDPSAVAGHVVMNPHWRACAVCCFSLITHFCSF